MNRDNFRALLESFGLLPLTARQGMAFANFEQLVQAAAAELDNLRARPYFVLWVGPIQPIFSELTKTGTCAVVESPGLS